MRIKNIGILAHVDAGKTSVTEQLLYLSGAIRNVGSVDSGTAQTDFLSIERERGISVRCAHTSFTYNSCNVNLIDTPGHTDFAGEVERSLIALDAAILVVSAVEGVQSHTENLWNALNAMDIPSVIFINKIDRAGSRFDELLNHELLTLKSHGKFVPFTVPQNEGSDACLVQSSDKSAIIEFAADFDDTIAEAFLEGQAPDEALLCNIITNCIAERKLFPVLCGSAKVGVGVKELLDFIVDNLPDATADDKLSGVVFGIEHDKAMGKIAHVRLFGGNLTARDTLSNYDDGSKISQIRKFNGQKFIDIGSVSGGDIAALCGLKNASVGDIIGEYERKGYSFVNPFLSVKATPADGGDIQPLLNALRELAAEEPLLNCKWEKTEREILVSITGKIQLDVLKALLLERYGLKAEFSPPSVIYKETPTNSGIGFDAYTMPKPCWAVVKLNIEPLPRGSGVVFEKEKISNNTLAYKYQDHIRTSFFQNLEQGPLGWEVTDFRCTLIGGEHHSIHTHPLDFFVATPMALMKGLDETGTTLLEPFLKIRITAQADLLGKLVSEILAMRGEFDQPVINGDKLTIEAFLPVATSLDFPVKLSSLSSGKATLFSSFAGYRECPLELGATTPRRGINPLDRSKWILYCRGAITDAQ